VTGDYVRLAPIATSLCSGAICREGPEPDLSQTARRFAILANLRPETSHDHGRQPRSRECSLLPAVGVWSRPAGGRAMRGSASIPGEAIGALVPSEIEPALLEHDEHGIYERLAPFA
jgi:hypothetical protein